VLCDWYKTETYKTNRTGTSLNDVTTWKTWMENRNLKGVHFEEARLT